MTHFVSRLVGTLWQRACHLPVIWKYGHIGNFLFWPSILLSYQIINKREDWGDKLFLAHRNWRKSRELSGWSVNPILVKDQKVWQHLPACNVQFGAESMSTEARRIWAAQFMGDFRYSSTYRKRRESEMIWVRRHKYIVVIAFVLYNLLINRLWRDALWIGRYTQSKRMVASKSQHETKHCM